MQTQESNANQFRGSVSVLQSYENKAEAEVSEIIEGTVRPATAYLHCLPAVVSPKRTRKSAEVSRQIVGSMEATVNWVAGYC